jgi:hypothetical protein
MKFAFLSLLIAVASTGVSSQTQQAEAPIKTTLCEIKAHPENFQHKLVEFTATASHGFEDSMVESDQCTWAHPVPNPGVWMEFGGKQSTDTMYCCGFSPKPDRPDTLKIDNLEIPLVEDDMFRQFNSALHPKREKPGRSVTVEATMRGMIFAERAKLAKNIPEYWGGYGHMGCCMLFVVTQVVSVGKTGNRPD